MQLGTRAHELGRALLDGFRQHDLLTYASAISFQILTAIIPFLLFVIALAGLLNQESVWHAKGSSHPAASILWASRVPSSSSCHGRKG